MVSIISVAGSFLCGVSIAEAVVNLACTCVVPYSLVTMSFGDGGYLRGSLS